MIAKNFGLHLMLDFYGCEMEPLASHSICYNALSNLPAKMKMHKLIPPYVIWADSTEDRLGKDPGGYSGFVMIAESHISLHTFIKRGFISIDVYSCHNFNPEIPINYFKNIFKPKKIEKHLIIRGKNYPNKNIY